MRLPHFNPNQQAVIMPSSRQLRSLCVQYLRTYHVSSKLVSLEAVLGYRCAVRISEVHKTHITATVKETKGSKGTGKVKILKITRDEKNLGRSKVESTPS